MTAGLSHLAAQPSNSDPESLDAAAAKAAAGTYREFIELLKIPNVSAVAADVAKNAAQLQTMFEKRGFDVTIWPNNGRPLVFAEMKGSRPDRKTVLFYMHLDGQPVNAAEWHQESPFDPVMKKKNADGGFDKVPLDRLYGATVDPEWRIFARSAGDDKGPIAMFLSAVDALHAMGREPAINIKIVLDPEEEGGGAKGLRSFVAERTDTMRADALVAMDGPMEESNAPYLVYGFRGGASVQIQVFGARTELHSGNYGNYTPNPLQRLTKLIGGMKDDDGRVTIPGFYDSVKIDPETRKALDAIPFDEQAFDRRIGIAQREKVGRNLYEAFLYPTLTVSRMTSGSLGANGRVVQFVGGVIPAVAEATIAIRVVPETPPAYLRDIFTKYVESQGYHLVNGQPTEEEREKYRDLAAVTVSGGGGEGGAMKTSMTSPVGDWTRRALTKAFGKPPDQAPILGATLPLGSIVQGLKVPFVIVPLANGDDNQHTSDENLRIGNYINGTKSFLALFLEKY